jgi:hypothetical protein
MLGDNTEKSKNPLKKAMRRRNAKTVQFTAPTYYEPSLIDYSDEEEGDGDHMDVDRNTKADEPEQTEPNSNDDAARAQSDPVSSNANGLQKTSSHESLSEDQPSSPVKSQGPDSQSAISPSDAVSRSRKGNVRNTDSFFKDDSVETKKISLTPRLLRGDSDSAGSTDQEVRQRPSLETFDKMVGSDEKPAKEEKKKEKKGMLSGLFKRKDKSAKGAKGEDRPDKISEESLRPSTHSKDSMESITKPEAAPERRPSKLQKHPPPLVTSPKSSPTETRFNLHQPAPTALSNPVQASITPQQPTGPAPKPPTVRTVQDEESQESLDLRPEPLAQRGPQAPIRPAPAPALNAHVGPPSEQSGNVEEITHRPTAKERFALDTSDSDDDSTPTAIAPQTIGRGSVSPMNDVQNGHRRNDSGMQISPIETPSNLDNAFEEAKMRQQERTYDSFQEPDVTPIDAEGTASTSKASPSTITTHTPSTSRSTPTWSDASLRMYMDDDQDIKDLLIIVHDKSNVMPVGPDHPLMANLFSDERTKLAEMQTQLDSMLMSWMSKKTGAAV